MVPVISLPGSDVLGFLNQHLHHSLSGEIATVFTAYVEQM